MNKNIKILVLVVLLTMSATAFGSLFWEENFDYTVGDNITTHGWTAHGNIGGSPILVASPGLTYTGYASSGIGNAATITGGTSREDDNKTFTSQTAGSVYAAFMVNVTAATTTADYIVHFGPLSIGTTFRGKVFVVRNALNNVAFGLSKAGNAPPPAITDTIYDLNTTYLLVLRYTFNTGTTSDDEVKLWVNPAIGGAEPPSNLTATDGADLSDCGAFALRQGSQAYTVLVDGIRVGTSWSDILPGGSVTPTQLTITSVNGGNSPSVNTPFSVTVQAQDAGGNPGNVTNATDVLLSLATGSGNLGGTLTGTISAGANTATITGVTYNTIEGGVSITATRTSGDILTPGTSAPFSVLAAASHLAFVNVPAGAQQNLTMGTFTVGARRPDNSVDLSYTDSITISIASGPGNISGTLKKACAAGVATFNDIELDSAGVYTLSATADGLTGATSSTINVIASTIPLIENFEYTPGTSLIYNGWSAHSGAGSNPLMVTTPGLTYTGYLSSGIGEATTVTGGSGSREDAHRIFTTQTAGSVYAAFMVNAGSASSTKDYFIHFGPQVIGTNFKGRVFVKDNSGSLAFGLCKGDSVGTFTPFSYSYNTTYLLVLKYTFIEGAANDEVKLWINPSLAGSEPTSDLTYTDAYAIADLSDCGSIALRQGSQSYSVQVDGIRVGTSWGILTNINPPTITDVSRNPSIPTSGQSFQVTAKIYDDSTALGSILDTLYYKLNSGSWNAIQKDGYNSADSIFTYTIPSTKAAGDTIFYQIHAVSRLGYLATSSLYRAVFPLELTIDQIQGYASSSPYAADYVRTIGIVTGVFGPRFFFSQRPGGSWNGLYCYRRVQDSLPHVNIGDSVTVVGVIQEYKTMTELNATATSSGQVTVISSGIQLPDTTTITLPSSASESFEGCLVRVDSVQFRATGTFARDANYWAIGYTGLDSVNVRIDSTATGIIGQTILTGYFDIIGDLTAFGDTAVANQDTYQIMPRFWSDFYTPTLDIGVTAVTNPSGTLYQGTSYPVKATIKNYGNVPAPSFSVIFTITQQKAGDYCDTVDVSSLDVGQELEVEFSSYTATDLGIFSTEARTELTGDMYAGNNQATGGGFEVVVAPTAGWSRQLDILSNVGGKGVKDGGALVGIASGKTNNVYAFRGKSREFYHYTPNTWTPADSIPNGVKVTDPTKINKKVVAKGASMCFDEDHTIYATKGNGTKEFWAYDIAADSNRWTAKAFVSVPKGLKGGTSIRWYDGKVYLLAGNQKKTDPNNFFVYDPTADTVNGTPWTALASLPVLSGTKQVVWKDGSSIIEVGGTFYALKANIKPNRFFSYDMGLNTWTELTGDTIPPFDSLLTNGVGKLKKVYLKDGAATTTDGSVIYATKGGGYNFVWKYTPGLGWSRSDSVPRVDKKSVIKTGGAMTYVGGYIYLLKGNNTLEMWSYGPIAAKSEVLSQMPLTAQTVNASQSEPVSNLSALFNISPNPFQALTTIRYTVPVSGNVSIKLYNAAGSMIQTIHNGYLNAGNYTTTLSNIASGIYFVRYENSINRAEIKLIVK